MLSDILTFTLVITGISALLLCGVFRLLVWREESFTFLIPLFDDSPLIYNRLCHISEICSFCGIHKKSTVILVNYGASDSFCEALTDYFKNENFIKIIRLPEEEII